MTIAALLPMAALLAWAVLPGLALASATCARRSTATTPSHFAGLIAVYGVAVWGLGSEVLAQSGAVRPVPVWLVAAALSVTSAVAVVRWLPRCGLPPLWRLPAWRHAWLAVAVLALAATPQLWLIAARPASMPGPTAWYYWSLTEQVVDQGEIPATTGEWGTEAPFLDDFPAFTTASATLAVAGGETSSLAAANVVRVATLVLTALGFWVLARTWGAPAVAIATALPLLLATETFATKLSSYRPESFGYGLMLLVPALALSYLRSREPGDLVAVAVGFLALSQIHGIAWLFCCCLLFGTLVTWVVTGARREGERSRLAGVAAVPVACVLLWAPAGFLLLGRVSDVGKLESVPAVAQSGVDPTYLFTQLIHDGAPVTDPLLGSSPPGTWDLAVEGFDHLLFGTPDAAYFVLVGALLATLALGAWRRPHAEYARRFLVLLGATLGAVGAVAMVFALGWDTFVPRRTGFVRVLPLIIVFVPLAMAVVPTVFAARRARVVVLVVLGLTSFGAWAAASPIIADINVQHPAPAQLAALRALDVEDDADVLANGYTEGFLRYALDARGVLEGRAPYTEAELLARADTLLSQAHLFFLDPVAHRDFLSRQGIDFVLVAADDWTLGTSRVWGANEPAIAQLPELTLVHATPSFRLYRVEDPAAR